MPGTAKDEVVAAPERRRYESPRRQLQAAQTREAVIASAARLFSERGWAGTGMRDVAREAGVSVETVYATVGSKADLLSSVLDVGVVGDDEPVALADRPEYSALDVGSREERLAAAGRLLRSIYERSAGADIALREAAIVDPALAKRLEEGRDRQRENVRDAAGLVLGRPVGDAEADELWVVISFEVYRLLVQSAGWSPEKYQDWVASILARMYPAADDH